MKKIMSLALAGVMVMSMGVTAFAADGDMAQPGKALAADEIADAVVASGEISAKNNKHYYEIDTTGGTGEYTARGASSVVVLTAEPTMFKAIVPIALHVNQAADMSKTYPDAMAETNQENTKKGYGSTGTAKIANLCPLGQIKVTDVDVVAATGYTITAWNADYENMQINAKNFGFQINGLNALTTGKLEGFAVGTKSISSSYNKNDGKTHLTRTYGDYTGFTREDSNTEAFPIIAHDSVLPITYEAKLPGFSAAVNNVNVGAVVFTLDYHTAPVAP